MKHPTPKQAFGPTINRIGCMASHIPRYAFKGVSRLARDARVHPSSVSRLISGHQNPSFAMVARLTAALEKQLGYKIDPRDLVAEEGYFLTPHICDVVGCPGCLPENAIDEFGDTKPAFQGIEPGNWVTSRYPRGFRAEKGVR